MSSSEDNIIGQNLRHTTAININTIRCGDLKIEINGYPLSEYEFEKLTSSGGGLKDWAYNFFLVGIGVFIVCVGKFTHFLIIFFSKSEDRDDLTTGIMEYELYSLGAAVGIGIILQVISLFYKNKKDKLISRIENFFNSDENV